MCGIKASISIGSVGQEFNVYRVTTHSYCWFVLRVSISNTSQTNPRCFKTVCWS